MIKVHMVMSLLEEVVLTASSGSGGGAWCVVEEVVILDGTGGCGVKNFFIQNDLILGRNRNLFRKFDLLM